MFESLTLTPFCFEKSSVRIEIFNVQATFSAWSVLKSGKICKNNDHTCLSPSFRPPCYLLLNHWTKSNQSWCVSCYHEWDVQRHIFLAPPPGVGPKGQISLNIIRFQLQSQFQRVFNQTLCVFSHM